MITRLLERITDIFSKEVRIYYYDSDSNFGDMLNADTLRFFGYTPRHISQDAAELFAIGSILDHCPSSYDGVVLGSGYMHSDTPGDRLKHAKLLALRGRLTAEKEAGNACRSYGDPGVLAADIFGNFTKTCQLGIVPHFVDKENPELLKFMAVHPNVKVIDVQAPVRDVIQSIASCDYIVSSSLHGIIVADSYGIPAGWLHMSDSVLGEGFKFRDYHSSLHFNREVIHFTSTMPVSYLLSQTSTAPAGTIKVMQEKLRGSYRSLWRQMVILRVKRNVRKAILKLKRPFWT